MACSKCSFRQTSFIEVSSSLQACCAENGCDREVNGYFHFCTKHVNLCNQYVLTKIKHLFAGFFQIFVMRSFCLWRLSFEKPA